MLNMPKGETSAVISARVKDARNLQTCRFNELNIFSNSQMDAGEIQKYCQLDTDSMNYLRHTIRELKLSARAYDRILKVARTIADLNDEESIGLDHIAEAVQYRSLDRRLW
jgi:magnesium chelatase family protein